MKEWNGKNYFPCYVRSDESQNVHKEAKNSINTNVNGWIKCVSESLWLHSQAITKAHKTFPVVFFTHIDTNDTSELLSSHPWECFSSTL